MKNNRILFVLKMPPPITGVTMVNSYVYDNLLIKSKYTIESLPLSYSNNMSELGSIKFNKIFRIIKYFALLLKKIILFRPKYVYFQISPHGVAFFRDFIFVLLMKLFGIKLIYHLHGKGIKDKCKSKTSRLLYRIVFRNSSVICLSPLISNDIEDVYKSVPYTVPNGIPVKNEVLKQKKNKLKVLFFSNLIISKGIINFIDAIALVKSDKFEAVIAGAEADLSKVEINKYIEKKQISNRCVYIGPKYGNDKEKLLEQTDILVFPTKNDSFPLVILDAMNNSIPVISTNEGAITEIIDDGVTGIILEKNTPENIAEKIDLLIDDGSIRKSMGLAGRKKLVDKYSISIFDKNMFETFEKIISIEK